MPPFIEALQLPFMSRALITLLVLAVSAAIVGLGINFRELEFLSDGLVHAVFPGLVIGAALGGSALLLPGALAAAVIAAVLFTLTSLRQRSGQDAAIAVGLTGLFSLGVVLISRQSGYVSGLQDLLFGQLLTVTDLQLVQIVIASVLASGIMLVTMRTQIYRSFDTPGFTAAGFSLVSTDLALTIATALLVVAGVQAFGVLMIVALLTVPMAVSRMLTRRLALLIPLASVVTLGSGMIGLNLSYTWSVGAGLTVSPSAITVLVMVGLYLLAVLLRMTKVKVTA